MNVLVAHPSADLYGSDRQLIQSVAAFRDRSWDVSVVVPQAGALTWQLGDADVVVARFPVLRKAQLRPLALLALALTTPWVVLRLVRMIRAHSADVVYVNTVTLPHWVFAARLARCKVVVHVHEAEELSAAALRRVLYLPLLAASRVIVNSATTRRVVTASWPRLHTRLVEIANGVPDVGAQPTSAIVAGRLAVISRLSPRKGVDIALETVARLRSRGRDVSVQLCGTSFTGYEWFEDELRQRAQERDLAGSVTFSGFVSDIRGPLAQAQVVLAPSFGESFGNAAVEGMFAERPVIASDAQGLAEIVTDGETGLLVPPGDVEALSRAVEQLLDDDELAQRLAHRARSEAARRFSTAAYRSEVARTVAELVGACADDVRCR